MNRQVRQEKSKQNTTHALQRAAGMLLSVLLAATVSACAAFGDGVQYSESEQAEVASIAEEIHQYRENESREAEGLQIEPEAQESNAVLETKSAGPGAAASTQEAGELIIFDAIQEDGSYTDKESVAYYIHTWHALPGNYISLTQARKLGWRQNADLWAYAEGKSIGGGVYNDKNNALPDAHERIWYECDIDYKGGRRGSKRLLYSNDGLIYYTEDNENFEQLY